jgi:hypothetical protein
MPRVPTGHSYVVCGSIWTQRSFFHSSNRSASLRSSATITIGLGFTARLLQRVTWRRSLSQSYIAIPGDKLEFPISLLDISARSLPRVRFGENLDLATTSRRARNPPASATPSAPGPMPRIMPDPGTFHRQGRTSADEAQSRRPEDKLAPEVYCTGSKGGCQRAPPRPWPRGPRRPCAGSPASPNLPRH